MQIIYSSKNLELTDGFKTFVERKLTKLKKFTSLGLSHLFVNVDVDRKHKGGSEDAVVEIVGNLNQKQVAVRDQGSTFYKAFFGAVAKLQTTLSREKEKTVDKTKRR